MSKRSADSSTQTVQLKRKKVEVTSEVQRRVVLYTVNVESAVVVDCSDFSEQIRASDGPRSAFLVVDEFLSHLTKKKGGSIIYKDSMVPVLEKHGFTGDRGTIEVLNVVRKMRSDLSARGRVFLFPSTTRLDIQHLPELNFISVCMQQTMQKFTMFASDKHPSSEVESKCEKLMVYMALKPRPTKENYDRIQDMVKDEDREMLHSMTRPFHELRERIIAMADGCTFEYGECELAKIHRHTVELIIVVLHCVWRQKAAV